MTAASAADPSGDTARATSHSAGLVRAWLWLVALLVLAMVVVGGATRLTGSGLSITEWQPIMGAIPPLSEADWQTAFAKYKAIPQYTELNRGMSLSGFKAIFWWEWSHRLLGRLVGIVFAVPLAWFWWRGALSRRFGLQLAGLLALGGLQGGIGWYMVKSGLVDRVSVSQYRLALHLGMAVMILGLLVWMALDAERASEGGVARRPATGLATAALAIVAAVLVQVELGALVAGLHAGLTYNTWPLMDGKLVPSGLLMLVPWYLNPFENVTLVQFDHRLGAYLLIALVVWHTVPLIRRSSGPLRLSATVLLAGVIAQAMLGIWTLLRVVPLHLAILHQACAALVFIVAVWHLHRLYRMRSA